MGDEIEMWWSDSNSNYDERIYKPDHIEVIQTRLNDETKIEVTRDLEGPTRILAPMEKGRFYYSVRLQWDSDLKGEAHYVFSVAVR